MSKRIDNTLCHCLKMRRSAENVIAFYDSILKPSGVTTRQYSLLSAVSKNSGCNVRILSDCTLLDRSTLARSLKPLIQLDYIRDNKAVGARDSILELTKKGVAVCGKAEELWWKAQQRFEAKFSKEQLEALENILEILQDF